VRSARKFRRFLRNCNELRSVVVSETGRGTQAGGADAGVGVKEIEISRS